MQIEPNPEVFEFLLQRKTKILYVQFKKQR